MSKIINLDNINKTNDNTLYLTDIIKEYNLKEFIIINNFPETRIYFF